MNAIYMSWLIGQQVVNEKLYPVNHKKKKVKSYTACYIAVTSIKILARRITIVLVIRNERIGYTTYKIRSTRSHNII